MHLKKRLAWILALGSVVFAQSEDGVQDLDGPGNDLYEKNLSACPGYKATKHWKTRSGFYADLSLAGPSCNVFGTDLSELTLEVEYQTTDRLHIKIMDTNNTVYQVPDSAFPRPGFGQWCSPNDSKLKFEFTADPFSFTVSRTDTGEILFDTTGNKLVFESQYLHLKTHLPPSPHLYGLGEHMDPFMLNTTNYTRTIYTRDAFGTPPGENLYGAHPFYFDHRYNASHGVFLLNSNGMDIFIDVDMAGQQYLEYNIIGGVLDFYFMAGPSPHEVAQQYAEIVQNPLMVPYWGLGFHQCRWGYRDVYEVAAVVANYSSHNIPLETMWTDIDYMNLRRVFTIDPERFPADLYNDLVDTIHARGQHYIVMVDPAVFYKEPNPALDAGLKYDTFIKEKNGSNYEGVVWAGPSHFPDWSNPRSQQYWSEQFFNFFDGEHGPDIDALWIDMNEPANFYNRPYPGNNTTPEEFARLNRNPPEPPPVRAGPDAPIPGFPGSLQPEFASSRKVSKRQAAIPKPPEPRPCSRSYRGAGHWRNARRQWGQGGWGQLGTAWQHGRRTGSGCGHDECKGLPHRELIRPPYMIQNGAGPTLADGTIDTDLVDSGGYVQYDTHNLYGAQMSSHSHGAMRARRPDDRAFVVTRSTFAGSGRDVSHWLGDNMSGWLWYRRSISQILQFAALYQIPVVGPDVCGFGGNVTETLCARWATLGSFYTFFRNHNIARSISQEFYRWPKVAEAARNGISIRYQLLDYIYTSIYKQNQTGAPALNPLFFNYPDDPNTFSIDLQFFYGDGILVSPVTEENSTNVNYYLPDDIFYEWGSGKPVRGHGKYVSAEVEVTDITIHYKGGIVVPQRIESANTTAVLRKRGFNIVIAPGQDGSAEGSLYLDDGKSVVPDAVSEIDLKYADGKFSMTGSFEYDAGVSIEAITVLGVESRPKWLEDEAYDAENKKLVLHVDVPLRRKFDMKIL